MTAGRKNPARREQADVPAPDSPSPSPSPSVGSGEYMAFVWQQLNDMQSRLGKIQGSIEHQTAAIVALEQKADATKEKIHSINIIIAVAAALVAVAATVTGFVMKEVWDIAKPLVIQRLTAEPAQIARPPQESPARAGSSPAK